MSRRAGGRRGPDGAEKSYEIADALFPSAVIRGRVFAANGKPLKGAEVSLKKGDARFWQLAANTDVDGRFETVKVSPGMYKLSIGHIRHVAHNRTAINLTRNGSILLDDVVLKKRE